MQHISFFFLDSSHWDENQGDQGGKSDSHPSGGVRRKNTNTNMLYLLDPGKFKKHIELTYAAVTASKNEYNCIFFPSELWVPDLAALVFFS